MVMPVNKTVADITPGTLPLPFDLDALNSPSATMPPSPFALETFDDLTYISPPSPFDLDISQISNQSPPPLPRALATLCVCEQGP